MFMSSLLDEYSIKADQPCVQVKLYCEIFKEGLWGLFLYGMSKVSFNEVK